MPSTVRPAPGPAVATVPGLELDWDSSVGWEVDRLPKGQTSRTRDASEYLRLAEASMDQPDLFSAILVSGVPLPDRSLIAKDAELCRPVLIEEVRKRKPRRLLVRVDDGLSEAGVACLGRLEVPKLYLGLCPDDGTSTMWRCDGDAELAALAAAPAVAARVHGLAIGFGERASWSLLTRFAQLEYLTVQSPAVADALVDPVALATLCARDQLVNLDLLDPFLLGRDYPLPGDCAYKRVAFTAESLPSANPTYDRPDDPPATGGPCRLRRLLAWHLDDDERRALRARCPDLVDIQTVDDAQ